jgi:CDP-glucose 4,6-dehydratase
VRWMMQRLQAAWPGDVEVRLCGGQGAHEAPALRLDPTLARQRLRWEPVWDLERALAATAAWHAGGSP